jgi:hypothetical protein
LFAVCAEAPVSAKDIRAALRNNLTRFINRREKPMKSRILASAAALLLAAGCGHKADTATYRTPQGTVTVKQDNGNGTVTVNGPQGQSTVTTKDGGGTVTVNGPQGQATVTSKDGNMTETSTDASGKTSTLTIGTKVDLSQLGVKLYPGATTKEGGSMQTNTPEGQSTIVQLETQDDVSKIIDFYKGEIKVENTTTTPQGGLISGTTPAGDKAMVVISKTDKGNTISLTVVKKIQK